MVRNHINFPSGPKASWLDMLPPEQSTPSSRRSGCEHHERHIPHTTPQMLTRIQTLRTILTSIQTTLDTRLLLRELVKTNGLYCLHCTPLGVTGQCDHTCPFLRPTNRAYYQESYYCRCDSPWLTRIDDDLAAYRRIVEDMDDAQGKGVYAATVGRWERAVEVLGEGCRVAMEDDAERDDYLKDVWLWDGEGVARKLAAWGFEGAWGKGMEGRPVRALSERGDCRCTVKEATTRNASDQQCVQPRSQPFLEPAYKSASQLRITVPARETQLESHHRSRAKTPVRTSSTLVLHPPKVAQGQSSSSPNKDSNANQNDSPKPTSESPAPSTSKGSSGKREFSTFARRMKEDKEPAVSQGKHNEPSPSEVKGAKPKILNENPPAAGEESEEVRKHNEDMSNRAEQAHERVSNEDAEKDKVPASFWKGEGGRGGSEGVKS
ncbi:conserved serine-rich [Pyrenophora seminiperda CCB06]|uniref:Conserved serine-rich n=1 Tax=Pyrenophora seminiperda CCB06 TaxID=1302712 RepID=A0A3M7MAV9_9PLEO|nr:conserved serine-rich [Pyrenophora seminiperda CCB06]